MGTVPISARWPASLHVRLLMIQLLLWLLLVAPCVIVCPGKVMTLHARLLMILLLVSSSLMWMLLVYNHPCLDRGGAADDDDDELIVLMLLLLMCLYMF